MIIDCISDLHGYYPELEGGDLLIVAGDLTACDKPEEHLTFQLWLMNQDYRRIVFIGGNHDNFLRYPNQARHAWAYGDDEKKLEYLCDCGTEFEGLKVWGTPWTLKFPGMNPQCMAFTVDTEEELAEKWGLIPNDVDILVTHSPPYGILDTITRDTFIEGHQCDKQQKVGSKSLLSKIFEKEPNVHVFGHIHEGYGRIHIGGIGFKDKIMLCNASHVNERYQPVNKPIRVIL